MLGPHVVVASAIPIKSIIAPKSGKMMLSFLILFFLKVYLRLKVDGQD